MARPQPLKPRKLPAQNRSAFTVDVIVEAAIRILLSQGYARMTTAGVAELAGVSVGSLYQYFPNKQALVAEIVRRRAEYFFGLVTAAPTDRARDLRGAVEIIMTAFLAEKRAMLDLSAALLPAMAEVQGRQTVIEAGRHIVDALADKLAPHLGRALSEADRVRLSIAIASTEGAVWEAISIDPRIVAEPGYVVTLSRLFMVAAELTEH